MKNRCFSIFLIGSALLLMLLFPDITLEGTRCGLLLWYQRFLPAVFPFMILSGLLTGYLKKGGAVFAVAAGFLNGYPIGAKTAADLKKKGLLPENTARYYAVFCNMSSPMFMTAYAGLEKEMPVIYLTSILLLVVFCKLAGTQTGRQKKSHEASAADAVPPAQNETGPNTGDYLLDCTGIMVKAGIYIMYFSILMELLSQPACSTPALKLLAPFLELTTGINRIGSADFPMPSLAGYYRIFLCVSGGLCTAFQSGEVTYDLNLSLPRYLLLKLIQASAACATCFVFHSAFPV
ncbi:MAG: hypothetical protein SO101_09440 [Lachnospiraceae bacterium]|nr:hypothetical protein [Lachnospiraceae bacterium]